MSLHKDRIRLVGLIHRLDGISNKEFQARMLNLVASIKELPVMQKNLLKYEMAFRVGGAKDAKLVETLALSTNTDYSAVVTVEVENHEKLMEAVEDPSFLKLLDTAYTEVFRREDFEVFTTDAPHIFLRICKSWRAIALSIAALWANLHLNLDYFPESIATPDYIHGFIEAHFRRACARPLSFSIQGWINDELTFTRLDSLVQRHVARLQSLDIFLDIHDFAFYAEPFPSLQKITIGFPDNDASELSLRNPIIMFPTAPRLREAHLAYGAILSLVSLPCASPVVHSGMQRFRLVSDTDETSPGADILAAIRFPNLHSLYLVGIGLDQGFPTFQFRNFLSYSSASLREFSFGNETAPTPVAAISWFSLMPKLTKLEIVDPERFFVPEFFRLLDRCLTPPTFLPHLQHLIFRRYSLLIDGLLIRALSSQLTAAHGPVHLRSVRFEWAPGNSWKLGEDVTAPLERHIGRGIDIYMGPPHRNELFHAILRAADGRRGVHS
ncbi:hypothetical protein C8R46DRAFT_1350772 [Mycena filopes]|nr:hypothetical protein C8R46DRAFT_1350772 [Mycena filopes]